MSILRTGMGAIFNGDARLQTPGPEGKQGLNSGLDFPFIYDENVNMGDPGTGMIRLNNSTLNLSTSISISGLIYANNTPDLSDLIATWGGGTFEIYGRDAPENFVIFTTTAVVDNGSWLELTVEAIASGGTIENGVAVVVAYIKDGVVTPALQTLADEAAASAASIDLGAIAESKNITPVASFIYDTTMDNDGGVWRHRCQHTGWYQEPLNTATRGATRKPPALIVGLVEAGKVTLYDATKTEAPMWMVFPHASAGFIPNHDATTSAAMKNGILVVGDNRPSGVFYGVAIADFVADTMLRHSATVETSKKYMGGGIADRATAYFYDTGAPTAQIVSGNISDIFITALPDAPIDNETGLPVPTIWAAGMAGVSQIGWDGFSSDNVWDWLTNVGSIYKVVFEDGLVASGGGGVSYRNWVKNGVLTADTNSYDFRFNQSSIPSRPDSDGNSGQVKNILKFKNRILFGGANNANTFGVATLHQNPSESEKGMVSYTSADYVTGMMVGDIKLAVLANSKAADRSINGIDLTEVGSISESAVADGAELKCYGGFSASDYLTATDASFVDALFAYGWQKNAGIWEFKSGIVSTAPIDGLTIAATVLKIEGTMDKSLLRLSATTPSVAQLDLIENTEKFWFEENAQITIGGSSSVVIALTFDKVLKQYHVLTSEGLSVFSEFMVRLSFVAGSWATISAHNGFVVKG